jgi:hypothetical protein
MKSTTSARLYPKKMIPRSSATTGMHPCDLSRGLLLPATDQTHICLLSLQVHFDGDHAFVASQHVPGIYAVYVRRRTYWHNSIETGRRPPRNGRTNHA